ncbi:MAG: ABC transporter ATP-binding protein [Bacilli bacterium]
MGKRYLVQDVSFSVKQGEVFGFLGPNGAGKTTTIRMIVGLISPTEGTIAIAGHSVQKEFKQAMRHVGCIVENPELYGYLTGMDNLQQFARMYDDVSQTRIQEVVELVGLDGRIHDRVKTYSLGMKQRLGIAQALLARPKLLILDEPTNGLDPAGIRELRVFVRKLVEEENLSVFISSHLLSEVQLLCDRVAIIHKGKMIREATIEELVRHDDETIVWSFAKEDVQTAVELFTAAGVQTETLPDETSVRVNLQREDLPGWNAKFVASQIAVYGMHTVPVTLEDLFMNLTGGEGHA